MYTERPSRKTDNLLKFLVIMIIVATGVISYIKIFNTPVNPCKQLQKEYCKDKSGWMAFDCLLGLEDFTLTEPCVNFLNIHRSCRQDINVYCKGKEMTPKIEKCVKSINNVSMTKACQAELNPVWKSNKHINKYNERRLEERRRYRERMIKKREHSEL